MSEAAPESTTRSKRQKRRPNLDTMYTINQDGSRNFLHPADVHGRWQIRKNLVWLLLALIYVALPWFEVGGRPLIYIDLPGRAAHLCGQTFTNQDFYLVFFLASGMGFALFVTTSLFGRIWCGFACPQTVFMEGVIRRLERWIEGPRVTRIRRNLGPWTGDKVWRKILKHLLILGTSYLIAHVFLSYFIPIRELLHVIRSSPGEHPNAFFWSMFWTGIMYFDYSWFREQTCLIVCPYGRLQSTLIDDDTVIIGYDANRGEPRSKGVNTGGDCIDCYRCVEVCPTGIDIRNGLQMECVGCTNCIDACDEIMDRIGKPRGLVRYDSERGFETGRRKFLRPRVWVYLVIGLVGLSVASLKISGRTDFQTGVVRSRGLPFVLEEDRIRNLYTIHLQNKSPETRSYLVAPGEADGSPADQVEFIVSQAHVRLESMDEVQLPVFAILPRAAYSGSFDLSIAVTDSVTGQQQQVAVRFRGP